MEPEKTTLRLRIKQWSKTEEFRYVAAGVAVMVLALLSALGKYAPALAVTIALAEVLALLIVPLIRRDPVLYYMLFIVFAGTALSNSTFVYNDYNAPLYTFVQLPFVQSTHVPVLLFLPLLILFGRGEIPFLTKLSEHRTLRNTLRFICLMFLTGALFGFVVRWCNDNSLRDTYDLWYYIYEGNLLIYLNLLFLTVGLTYCFLTSEKLVGEFENYLLVFLFGISAATVLSVLFGWSADYMDNTTLLLSQAAIFSVFLLVYPLYGNKPRRVKILSLVLGAASVFAMLIKSSELGGKWWIYVFFTLLVLLFKMFFSKKLVPKIVAVAIALGAVGVVVLFMNVDFDLGLSETKMHQFFDVLNVFGPHWYSNLPESPKVRIDELVNVVIEYVKKPYFALFGKGFAATVTKHWGETDWSMESVNVFSRLELKNQVFGIMHETVNRLVLAFGLVGVAFIVRETWFVIRRFKDSFPCLIGFLWFIFFYNTVYSALYIGLCCFLFAKIGKEDAGSAELSLPALPEEENG